MYASNKLEPITDIEVILLDEKIKKLPAKFLPNGYGGGANAEVTAESIKEALGYTPADKDYVISVFEELKELIKNENTEGAIAVLDQAILDLSKLA